MTSPLMQLTPLPQQGQAPYLVQDNYNNPRLQNRLDGIATADFTSGDVTLTLDSGSTAGTASYGTVVCTNAAAPHNLIYPAGYTGPRLIVNNSGQVITVKTSASGTTVAVANGKTADVLIDGNDVTAKSGVTGLSVTAPITDTGTGTAPVVGISAATSGAAGSMSAADKAKLDAATNTNTPSTMVQRDAAERAQFADPSASQDAATKGYTDTADALRLKLDGSAAMTGALDMASHLISNLLDPVSAQDAATRAWVLSLVIGILHNAGNIDASANPNYPAGTNGDAYYVSVAGKVGGASGKSVDVGDVVVCKADNAGGTEASVGTSWYVIEHNLIGAVLSGNNLSDLASAATARANLGVAIGTDVQAYSAKLAAIAALTWAANKIIYTSGASTAAIQDFTALAQALLACTTQGDMQNAIGLILGTTVQAWDADLDALAALATNGLVKRTGAGTAAIVTAPSGAVVGDTDVQTLSGKRIARRVVVVNAPGATPSINTDNTDLAAFTGLNAAITSMTTNLSGTPVAGDELIIEFTDDGTGRAITWGSGFENGAATLPSPTVAGTLLVAKFYRNTATSKWRCMATG